MAIKTLEQEPNEVLKMAVCCEDAISRQSVLEWIQQSLSKYGSTYTTDMLNMWGLFEEQIKTFPSVKQEPKTGHWNNVSICGYRCSECGKIQYADDVNELNYCCTCGAKMVESHRKVRKYETDR